MLVSTHSRLKAAGNFFVLFQKSINSFNTQPPEGGWLCANFGADGILCFNTQPPEGGWAPARYRIAFLPVSTHSRLKAAGRRDAVARADDSVSTHSRLKAAGNQVVRFPFCVLFQHTAA